MHYTNWFAPGTPKSLKQKNKKNSTRFEVEWVDDALVYRFIYDDKEYTLDRFDASIHLDKSFIGKRAFVSSKVEFEVEDDGRSSNNAVFHFFGKRPRSLAFAKLIRAYEDERDRLKQTS